MPEPPETGLIEYTTAEQLAGTYRDATARLRKLLAEVGEECDKLRTAFETSYHFDISLNFAGYQYYKPEPEDIEKIIGKMKLDAWKQIIEKLSIRRLMSSKRVEELDDALSGKQGIDAFPELTPEAIQQVAGGYLMSATEFLEEAIAEEYEFWKPDKRHAPYVRNSEWKIARKIIRPNVVECGYSQAYRCSHYRRSHVTALDNLFHMLDGRGPVKDHYGPLRGAIETTADGTGETDYFKFKCHKNGNLHLEFKRQDLLDLFNSIAGKKVLAHDKEVA
jgi:hypothetical protein